MKKLTNYIVEKYKLTKNTMCRSIHVKGNFYLEPDKQYYLIRFMTEETAEKYRFTKDHLIYETEYRVAYLYSKEDLINEDSWKGLMIREFDNKFKSKIQDILDNLIPFSEYGEGETLFVGDLKR